MRVLIVNTSERTGGAAVAANRLMDALNNNGVKAKMLVMKKETDNITVVGLKDGWRQRWHFLWERFTIYCHLRFHRDNLFQIDTANAGTDITKLPEFQEADVIHLSWINQGFLSLKNIQKILKSGKAVVWTMHDLWPATGICHYSADCTAYQSVCANCPLLPNGGSNRDLSTRIFNRKKKIYNNSGIHFVGCSKWIAGQARSSALLSGLNITQIPNPIDTHIYYKKDRQQARLHATLPADKRIILFVSQRVTMERKGITFFIDAIQKLAAQYPEMKDNTVIAIMGGHAEEIQPRLALPSIPLGYVGSERQIVDIYNASDVYVLPSLGDNLPNTIMEAMACGVPSVAFRVGGIPEMIDHQKNGYLAKYRDADDLATGIHWVLDEADADEVSRQCLQKVGASYSQRTVAMKYIEVYNQALAFKNYKL